MSERRLLEAFESEFRKTRLQAEAAIAQVDDAGLHARLNPQQNSMAVIVQHMAGNMLSRFSDFLTTDGEKPSRDRESEFVDRDLPRAELMNLWERGWTCLFGAIGPLTDADLARTVIIRREPHTVFLALVRQTAHYAWHVGQIALIAKHLVGERWSYLTIPPRRLRRVQPQDGAVILRAVVRCNGCVFRERQAAIRQHTPACKDQPAT